MKYRNFNLSIYYNPPDYKFQYIIQEDKNYYWNNIGRGWISDDMETDDLVID